jgi:hypothetical protein
MPVIGRSHRHPDVDKIWKRSATTCRPQRRLSRIARDSDHAQAAPEREEMGPSRAPPDEASLLRETRERSRSGSREEAEFDLRRAARAASSDLAGAAVVIDCWSCTRPQRDKLEDVKQVSPSAAGSPSDADAGGGSPEDADHH